MGEVRFLDFSCYVLIIVAAFLSITSAFVVLGSAFFSLECSEATVTFCDYQTFSAGLFAILAALISGFIVWRQIEANNQNHFRDLRIKRIRSEYEETYKKYAVASCLASEISALTSRVKNEKYIEHFDRQIGDLQYNRIKYVSAFEMSSHYFLAFDTQLSEIGTLLEPLPEQIIEWYYAAKGCADTVQGINQGGYAHNPQEELSKDMKERLVSLVEGGDLLAKKLRGQAGAYKKTLSDLQWAQSQLEAGH